MEIEWDVGEAPEVTWRFLCEKPEGRDGCFPWSGKADGGAWFSLAS